MEPAKTGAGGFFKGLGNLWMIAGIAVGLASIVLVPERWFGDNLYYSLLNRTVWRIVDWPIYALQMLVGLSVCAVTVMRSPAWTGLTTGVRRSIGFTLACILLIFLRTATPNLKLDLLTTLLICLALLPWLAYVLRGVLARPKE